MKASPRTTLKHSTVRVAVAITATLAGAVIGSPAQAEEIAPQESAPAPETPEAPEPATPEAPPQDAAEVETPPAEPTPESTPTDAGPDGEVVEELPLMFEPTEAERPTVVAPADEVEPDYGYQKFRVGVRAEDGSTSTAGSTFEVTFSGSEDPADDDSFTCTTVAQEGPAEDGEEAGASYCVDDTPTEAPARVAAASSVGTTSSPYFYRYVMYAPPGATVSVRQLTAAAGLAPTRTSGSVQPCRGTSPLPFVPPQACVVGDPLEPEGVYSSVMFVNGRIVTGAVSGGASDDDVAGVDALLPDTGATDDPWRPVLAALAVATGLGLIAGSRRRPLDARRR